MKKLNLVVAASGTGKDYIVDKLCKEFGMKKVKSRTTRKPRYDGEDTHIFISKEQGLREFNSPNIVARTNYNGYMYYTLPEDFKDIDFYIIDVEGVRSMNDNILSQLNCRVVFIDAPWYIRFKHMRKREDSLFSILNRLWLDRKEFTGFKGDLNFKSSNEFYEFIKGEING